MLILAVKPDHDGAIAAIEDRKLLFSLEAEKDSYHRHATLGPTKVLELAERLGRAPDVVALGGWREGHSITGAGYSGQNIVREQRKLFGRQTEFFSSSHERSHIAMACGMAPPDDSSQRAVLLWEGALGRFYLVDEQWNVVSTFRVRSQPGARYAFLFGLADPKFPDYGSSHRLEDAGKLMALAAFGDAHTTDPAVLDTVQRIIDLEGVEPAPKYAFQDSPIYNAGVESQLCKDAAAVLNDRIFELFRDAAERHLPRDIPLHISGGCGLNCDWNMRWRELGYFSSVFVPPCTDDSGSALGTAIDALVTYTGSPHIEWDVYAGLEFVRDRRPDPALWEKTELRHDALSDALTNGAVVAWVQGRWEIGPRALGNRSLLAEPFNASTRDALNKIKLREDYRPIAPVCRIEDVDRLYTGGGFEDPYMLYFRSVREDGLEAVKHVDGTARVQTVSKQTNAGLHELLDAFAERNGAGVLCNTSLNFQGRGFINRMSHLIEYCELRGISDMVVDGTWYRCRHEVEPGEPMVDSEKYPLAGAVTGA
jgi:hydroxymethyl cephem carbamoyltransferase